MADALLAAACLIYVLHMLGEPPSPAGELDFRKYEKFRDLQTAVVDEVVKTGSFSDYKRRQLEGGFFFVLPHPPDGSRPARPSGSGIVAGSITLSPGDCILLDISSSESAAHAHAPPTPRPPRPRPARPSPATHPPAFAHPHHALARPLQVCLLLLVVLAATIQLLLLLLLLGTLWRT